MFVAWSTKGTRKEEKDENKVVVGLMKWTITLNIPRTCSSKYWEQKELFGPKEGRQEIFLISLKKEKAKWHDLDQDPHELDTFYITPLIYIKSIVWTF